MTLISSRERVSVETIQNGVASGGTAQQIMTEARINPGIDKVLKETRSFVGNATVLPHEVWIEMDRVILEEANIRLVGVADLQTPGLTKRTRGLGATVIQWQDSSNMEPAEVAMDGSTRSMRDRIEYTTKFMPLPIVFKDFSFSTREIEASAGLSVETIDTGAAREAGRLVAEEIERMLFKGLSTYTAGGGTIYGYEDFISRNTGSLTANWDASASTGITIRNDVANMLQSKRDDRQHGDAVLYIPTGYQKVLDDDYRANYPKSIQTRLLELNELSSIKVADQLTANNVVLVQLTQDNVRLVIGLDIQTIHWSTNGLTQNFKVMAVMIPNLRATQGARSGIIHYT